MLKNMKLQRPWIMETCNLERKGWKVGGRRDWFLSDPVVTRGRDRQLCWDQLLKVKLTNGIYRRIQFPGTWVTGRHRKMHTNKKKRKYTTPCLLLSVIAEMTREHYVQPSSDWFLWALDLSLKGKNYTGRTKSTPKTSCPREGSSCGEGAKPRNYRNQGG